MPKIHPKRSLSVVAATLAIGALALTVQRRKHIWRREQKGGGSSNGLL